MFRILSGKFISLNVQNHLQPTALLFFTYFFKSKIAPIKDGLNDRKFVNEIFQLIPFLKDDMIINKIESERIINPFFSIIITTYNRADLLPRALDSLIRQTETDWEGIIIDDGSTDDTATVVLPYLKPGSKFRYIRQENAGYSGAKNTGIFTARGKFITFLDSDDEYLPMHLALRKTILISNKVVEFLHGGFKVIGSVYVPDRFDYSKMISLKDCVIAGTFFIKRTVALLFKGFHELALGSDGDLFDRLDKAGVIIMKTEIPTYIYHRETVLSITHSFGKSSSTLPNPEIEGADEIV